jgi:hypothetical protein
MERMMSTRKHGGDRKDFVGALVLRTRDEHFGKLRIQWKLGHDASYLQQLTLEGKWELDEENEWGCESYVRGEESEKKASGKKASGKKASEQKASENKASENKASEKKASEKKASSWKKGVGLWRRAGRRRERGEEESREKKRAGRRREQGEEESREKKRVGRRREWEGERGKKSGKEWELIKKHTSVMLPSSSKAPR